VTATHHSLLLTLTNVKRHFPRCALLSLLLLATGCARTINRSAERKIRDALPSYIGPARVWRAHVENPPERTIQGRLRRIMIDGEQVRLRQTIVCDTLHIEMQDAVVDTGRQRLRSVGLTTFAAVIGERNLNDYLRRDPPEDDPIRIKRVQLRQGVIHVEATRYLLGVDWPFTLTIEPRLASETRLDFDPEQMTVLGLRVPLPSVVLRWFARRLNQGFDFSTLPFPLRITRFRVDTGRVTVEGIADVMQSLNERIGLYLKPPGEPSRLSVHLIGRGMGVWTCGSRNHATSPHFHTLSLHTATERESRCVEG